MRRHGVSVTAKTSAPRSAVYRLLADGTSWPQWSPIDRVEWKRAGHPPPEGVGAIRVHNFSGEQTTRAPSAAVVTGARGLFSWDAV
jgi:hypothetical protein